MATHLREHTCAHCGTPFTASMGNEQFCCEGCAFVHDLIKGEGLGLFYDLKGSERLLPAGPSVLLPTQTAWAEEAQAMAESKAPGALAETKLDLQGVTCMGCVWLIEAVFKQQGGAGRIFVNAQRGEATLSWAIEQFDLPRFAARLASFGYQLGLPSHSREEKSDTSGLRLGLAGGLALNAMAFTLPRYLGMGDDFALARVFELVAAASATLSLLACGSYFISRAWSALRLGQIHIDAPISIGLIAAWLGSVAGWLTDHPTLLYFDFVATFIFLMLLGRRWQELSAARHRSRLLRADPLTQLVRVEKDGQPKSMRQVSELERGDVFCIPSGGVNPVSSDLLDASGSLSLEWITGEAEPRAWAAGGIIPPGAVNLGRADLRVRAREDWGDSFLAKLCSTPPENHDHAAARQRGFWLRFYLGVVMLLALAGGVFWARTAGWTRGLQVFISVLVVSCPCALGVALPLAHEMAVARLRRVGLFVRRPDLWGRLRHVRQILFDKTGTLTLEAPQLVEPRMLEPLPATARHALSQLVRESRHPLSVSLRQTLAAKRLLFPAVEPSPEEYPGQGLVWKAPDGAVWSLGQSAWQPPGIGSPTKWPDDADSDAVLRCDGVKVAGFHFTEASRPDAAAELGQIHALGYKTAILSGDRPEKVESFARLVGIASDDARSRLTPEAKAFWIKQHAPDSLYVGDGANDSLAFDSALVRGTPAIERGLLTEKADFYFLSRGIQPIRQLLLTARHHRRVIRQAFAFALTYNLAVITLSLAGKMTPLLAAILMPLSSIITLIIVSWEMKARR